MPDSLLPIQGPASQRERDLDALLSGEAGYPVMVPRPVADALAALRAAPAPDELDGEAAARAAFRLYLLPGAGAAGGAHGSSAFPQVPAPFRQGAVAGAGCPDGQGLTVVLPRAAPGGPRHARPRRRLPRHGRWQVMAAACGTAAAVITGVVALAGGFSGPSGHQGQPGQPPSASASSASSHRAISSVLGTATARPTPTPSAVSPQALCRQFMDFLTHPEPRTNWPAENAVVQQLAKLSGGQLRIIEYCVGQLGAGGHGHDPAFQGGPGAPGGGHPQGRDGFGGPGAPRVGGAESAFSSGGARLGSAGPFRAGRTAR
jgi:hypothetical protein